MKRIIACSLFLIIAPAVYGAGFDCSKAVTSVEKMICDTRDLSLLDSEMSRLYNSTKRKKSEKHVQSLWLKERNACNSIECLESSYSVRIAELRGTYEFGAIYDVVLDNGDKKTLVLPYRSTKGWQGSYGLHPIEGYVKEFSGNKFVIADSSDGPHQIKLVEGEISSDRVTGNGRWTSDGKSYNKFVMTRKMTYIESKARCVGGYDSISYIILGNKDFERRVRERAVYCDEDDAGYKGVETAEDDDTSAYTENFEVTSVVYLTDNFLSLRDSGSSYQIGTLHPNHGSSFRNYIYHEEQYTQVNLDHFIVDTPECKKKLTAAISVKLASCDLQAENAYVNDENITPTNNGIIVHYNPYEVGGYVEGEPEIYLSRDSLGGCLKNLPEESIYGESEGSGRWCSGDD